MKKFAVILFFCSGFSALVYQVLWNYQLSILFGSAIWSVSCVIFSYMIGMALGSWLLGKYGDRSKNLMSLFAYLQLCIAGYAFVFPFLLQGVEALIHPFYPVLQTSLWLNILVKFFLSFLLLIFPTFLMGGTYPVFTASIMEQKSMGKNIGLAYGLNTLGAAFGGLCSGFLFIPVLKIPLTNYLAIGINIAVAICAMVITRQFALRSAIECDKEETCSTLTNKEKIVPFLFLMSGMAALALEGLWTRALILIFGSTTYSFSLMLFTFLFGMGLGSLVIAPLLDHWSAQKTLKIFAVLEVIMAAVVILTSSFISKLPLYLIRPLSSPEIPWLHTILFKSIMGFALMIVPTFLLGAIFPLLNRWFVKHMEHRGARLGYLYSINTVGSAFGVLLPALILLPFIGLKFSFIVISLIFLLVGLVCYRIATVKRVFLLSILSITAWFILAFFQTQTWNMARLMAGVSYRSCDYIVNDKVILDKYLSTKKRLFLKEATSAIIAVERTPYSKALNMDGKIEVSDLIEDIRLVKMIAHIPLLIHENPQRVLNIGFGAGITVGVMTLYPNIQKIYSVEIEPAVLEVAPFFKAENYTPLDDPRVVLINDDGINYLKFSREKFDIITVDPHDPIMRGASNLYSLEFLNDVKEHLNPHGLVANWLPLYLMPRSALLSILKTFSSVFPHTSVWWTGTDCILLGSEVPLKIDFADLTKHFGYDRIAQDLRKIGYPSTYDFLIGFMGQGTLQEANDEGIVLNTQANLFLEYEIPKYGNINTVVPNVVFLMENLDFAKLPVVGEFNTVVLAEYLRKRIFLYRGFVYLNEGLIGKSIPYLETLVKKYPDAYARDLLNRAYFTEGIIQQSTGSLNTAYLLLNKALGIDPCDYSTLFALARVSYEMDKPVQSLSYTEQALRLFDADADLYYLRGTIFHALGDDDRARHALSTALRLYPKHKESQALLTKIQE
jgi:spermidine synthase